MRVSRTVLAVLVALPLVVAGVFGWAVSSHNGRCPESD